MEYYDYYYYYLLQQQVLLQHNAPRGGRNQNLKETCQCSMQGATCRMQCAGWTTNTTTMAPTKFGNCRLCRGDRFCPKIMEIGAIPTIFQPFKVFYKIFTSLGCEPHTQNYKGIKSTASYLSFINIPIKPRKRDRRIVFLLSQKDKNTKHKKTKR